jgi:hypothetical protein
VTDAFVASGRFESERPGAWVDYYEVPEIAAQWRGGSGTATGPIQPDDEEAELLPPTSGSRAWVIGAGEGARRWPTFFEDGIVAIGWDDLGDLRQYEAHGDVHAAIKHFYESDQQLRGP